MGATAAVQGRRQPHQRRADPSLVRSFRCPRCAGEHAAAECDAGVTTLDARELRRLRVLVLEEIAAAVRADAGRDHLDQVLAVLAGVDARIAREADRPAPSAARRLTIAALPSSKGPRF